MIINIVNEQNSLEISVNQVQKLVQHVLKKEGVACDEVNLYFVDTLTISQLHAEYFNDPSTTDCISFPIDEDHDESLNYRILGEIFICPSTAISYAIENEGDAYKETSLYIIHGLLHLLGHDDIEQEDILKMREAENRHMQEIEFLHLQLKPLTD